MTESEKGIYQKYRKGAMKDCFIFYSWFYSKKSEEYEMEFGSDLIGMIMKIPKDLERRPFRSLQRISQEVLTSC